MFEAYLSFDGLVSVIFGIACIVIVFLRTTINGVMSFIDWSVLFIGLIYGFSAPLVIHAMHENPDLYVGAQFLRAHEGMYGVHTIVVAIATLGLFGGWAIATSAGKKRGARWRPLFQGLDDARRFGRVFWVMLGVALLAQTLYSADYGGLTGVVDYARLVRSGLISEVERSRFSFLRPIAGFSLLAAYGFLGLLLKRQSRNFGAFLGFIASFAFSLYVLETWQGRLGVATFIGGLALAAVIFRGTKPVTLILGFVGAAVLGMYGVYLVSEIWNLKTSESFSSFYATEISFVFTGFWAEFSAAQSTTRLFYDVLVLPLFLLPSSWTSGWFENVKDVHTATMWGAAKGQGGVTSGMPLDFVTLGFLQMNVIGVFLFALLFGILLRCLQTMVEHVELTGVRAALTAYIALRIAALGLFYAHPEHMVASNLPLIISLLLLWMLRGRRDRAERRTPSKSRIGRI